MLPAHLLVHIVGGHKERSRTMPQDQSRTQSGRWCLETGYVAVEACFAGFGKPGRRSTRNL